MTAKRRTTVNNAINNGFDLSKIESKPLRKPPVVVVYGESGIGKTRFAASAPQPVFLDIEKGASYLDVPKVQPSSLAEVNGWLDVLLRDKHDYKTLVIDSLDWLEMLIHKHVCEESGAADIADKRNDATAYGRGHIRALNKFIAVREKLESIRTERGMAVIITAHSIVKRFDDPVEGGYDRHVLKTHERIHGACVEWADAVMLAKKKHVLGADGKTREGDRILLSSGTLSAIGKNRLKLPKEIPLSWNNFVASINKEDNIAPAT
jgi:hypothetical protein